MVRELMVCHNLKRAVQRSLNATKSSAHRFSTLSISSRSFARALQNINSVRGIWNSLLAFPSSRSLVNSSILNNTHFWYPSYDLAKIRNPIS